MLDTVLLRYDVVEDDPVVVIPELEDVREEALGVKIDEGARAELESRVDDVVDVPCDVTANDGLGRYGGGPRLSALTISAAWIFVSKVWFS